VTHAGPHLQRTLHLENTTQLRLIDSGSGDGYRVPVNHTTEFLATVDDHEV